MEKLFGTDGIRGIANRHPLTPEMAGRIGKAVGTFFHANGRAAIIGKDTRLSGDMLEAAMAAGIASTGMPVHCCGILPTPGISYLTLSGKTACGIVISASHNPFQDNGIKIFGPDGYKLSDDQERRIEALVFREGASGSKRAAEKIGSIGFRPGAVQQYTQFLQECAPAGLKLDGLRIAIDCSNGATYRIAPQLFASLGAEVIPLGIQPNGENINADCGSEHTENLAETVTQAKAHMGIAFDGDGDRMVVVDERGGELSGDQVLSVAARYLQEIGRLANDTIVATVMSNIGLKKSLGQQGISVLDCRVGDRYVMEQMRRSGAVLGGENSGHMIFHHLHRTGDGMIAAIQFLAAYRHYRLVTSKLADFMTIFPQVLINVPVREKPDIDSIRSLRTGISKMEARLGKDGRVLVRYSGTQPMCRVMVEGPDARTTEDCCRQLADIVKTTIGE